MPETDTVTTVATETTGVPAEGASETTGSVDSTPATDDGSAISPALKAKFEELGIPPGEPDDSATETKPAAEEAETEGETGQEDTSPITLTAAQQRTAESFGLSEDDLAVMGETAPAVLAKLTKSQVDVSRKMAEMGRAMQKQAEAGTPSRKDADAGDATEDDGPIDLTTLGEFSAADWGADAAALNTMAKAMARLQAKVDATDGWVAARDQETQTRKEQAAEADTDAFFAGLDQRTYSRFGKAPLADVGEDSPEGIARKTVTAKVEQLRAGYAALYPKRPEVPLTDVLQEALRIVAADDIRTAAVRDHSDKIENRSRQRVARPTARAAIDTKTPAQSKTEAGARIAEHMRTTHGVEMPKE